MLYAVMRDGQIQRVVDSATDLDRMPVEMVKRMCRQLQIPWRGVSGDVVRVEAIRPERVARWDVSTQR